LREHFDQTALWSNFEQTLADLDIDTLLERAEQFLVDYGAEDWSDLIITIMSMKLIECWVPLPTD